MRCPDDWVRQQAIPGACAATFGWIAGKSGAERAKRIPDFQKAEKNSLVEDRVRI
jgi:hypothetical protein